MHAAVRIMRAFSHIALPRIAWNKRRSAYRLWQVYQQRPRGCTQ